MDEPTSQVYKSAPSQRETSEAAMDTSLKTTQMTNKSQFFKVHSTKKTKANANLPTMGLSKKRKVKKSKAKNSSSFEQH